MIDKITLKTDIVSFEIEYFYWFCNQSIFFLFQAALLSTRVSSVQLSNMAKKTFLWSQKYKNVSVITLIFMSIDHFCEGSFY